MPALTRRAALAAIGAALAGPALAQTSPDAVPVGEAQAPSDGADIALLFAKPGSAGPAPIVLVAEAGPALADFTRSACRTLAQHGYLAVAPALFATADPADAILFRALDAAARWAAANGGDPVRLGMVGFGLGGRATWLYDSYSASVKAAVAWGGPLPALDTAAHLHGPLLGLYGKNDGTPQRALLDAEAKAKQAGRKAEIVQYIGAGADFAAIGQPSYSEAAALDGWKRTLAWLQTNGVG